MGAGQHCRASSPGSRAPCPPCRWLPLMFESARIGRRLPRSVGHNEPADRSACSRSCRTRCSSRSRLGMALRRRRRPDLPQDRDAGAGAVCTLIRVRDGELHPLAAPSLPTSLCSSGSTAFPSARMRILRHGGLSRRARRGPRHRDRSALGRLTARRALALGLAACWSAARRRKGRRGRRDSSRSTYREPRRGRPTRNVTSSKRPFRLERHCHRPQ